MLVIAIVCLSILGKLALVFSDEQLEATVFNFFILFLIGILTFGF